MISAIRVYRSIGTVPYGNIALETFLTLQVREGECILFLWQNRDTVVIGRNQNAWEECRVQRFRENHGMLARRLSGGGAVYHDLGNLNFSFAARKADFDPARQSEVILRAMHRLGVPAVRTGRNDFEADGRKFSGNAFYEQKGCCCHHGTLMMDVDLSRMEEALTVPMAKLRSRGVSSVRSRVVNISAFCPGLSRERLEGCLTEAFGEVYGLIPEELEQERLDEEEIRLETARMASDAWILGRRIPFTSVIEDRFPWGGIRLELSVNRGRVEDAVCWSDAMYERIIPDIGNALKECAYDGTALAERVLETVRARTTDESAPEMRLARDIAGMIRDQTEEADRGRNGTHV